MPSLNVEQHEFMSATEWPIEEVTVYSDRALVSRIIRVPAQVAGENSFKLIKVSANIYTDSLRADVKTGNASLCEVSLVRNPSKRSRFNDDNLSDYPDALKLKEDLEELDNKIREKEKQRNTFQAENTRRNEKLAFLKAYADKTNPNTVGRSDKELKMMLADMNKKNFKEFIEYYEQAVKEIDEEILSSQQKINELNAEISKIRNEKTPLNSQANEVRSDAVVLLDIPEETVTKGEEIEICLNYLVRNCGWTSSYDARVDKADKKVNLQYFGKVRNNTDESWEDIDLSLSTAEPSKQGNLPKLPRIGVKLDNFGGWATGRGHQKTLKKKKARGARKDAKKKKRGFMSNFGGASQAEELEDDDEVESMMSEGSYSSDEEEVELEEEAPVLAEVSLTEANAEGGAAVFKVSRKVSIPKDSTPRKQKILSTDLAAEFFYVVAPKNTPYCYRKCITKNTSGYVFTAGPLAVFFDGSYVTTSQLNAVQRNQSFSFYLGLEEKVNVDYSPENRKQEVQSGFFFAGKNKTSTASRVIKVNNTGNEDIDIILYEEVPLSKNDEIKVELLSPKLVKPKKGKKGRSAVINAMNHLEVRDKIKARSKWSIEFKCKVEWPKTKELLFTSTMGNMANMKPESSNEREQVMKSAAMQEEVQELYNHAAYDNINRNKVRNQRWF
eukprot:maker-scaffold_7-snap-gene-11.42-mRNA-1 protein AED:0.00 eAED:0.00 QI:365/1/1/1/1/1/2/104/668